MTEQENRGAFLLELKGRGYLFENTSWMTGLGGHSGIFEDDQLQMVWEVWNASAQREGFKLMPLEPTKEMLVAARSKETNLTDACKAYKAMINAV